MHEYLPLAPRGVQHIRLDLRVIHRGIAAVILALILRGQVGLAQKRSTPLWAAVQQQFKAAQLEPPTIAHIQFRLFAHQIPRVVAT